MGNSAVKNCLQSEYIKRCRNFRSWNSGQSSH